MSLTRPALLLVLLSLASLAARAAWLGAPCQAPCRTDNQHARIFDETYYVNAARVIAGITPPAGAHYAQAPLGDDPNSEHPQGAKLVIAGAIELFGDGPFAWRIGSLVMGSLAILGMWFLVRGVGAGEWVALGAAGLMAFDNLLLVAGRIGTLDIYAVAAMVWGIALYLRGRWLWAAAVLAIGMACKEVAVYALLVVALVELAGVIEGRRDRAISFGRLGGGTVGAAARRAGLCAAGAVGGFVALLALMDRIAPPYDPGVHRLVTGGVFGHIAHIISYASHLESPRGPKGIASYPWEWLADLKPIVYLSINPARPTVGLFRYHPISLFLGMVSPPILALAIPSLGVGMWAWAKRAGSAPDPINSLGVIGLAWFAGTFGPFELFSLIWQRTSYLYYMIVVMPGIYLAVAAFIHRFRRHRRLVCGWIALVVVAAIVMYPLTPILQRF